MRKIRTKIDLAEGVASLIQSSEQLSMIHALAGPPPLRRRAGGFKGLSRIVVGQQLSVASAAAIWSRLERLAQPFTAQNVLALPESALRSAGLSAGKIATLRGLAESIATGRLKLDRLAHAPEEAIHAELTSLRGIGPWTADIYMLFCLARADAWSPGDLALQLAVRDVLALEQRPSETMMIDIAEPWRPWRAVAARMLWSYYALRRKTSALPA